MPKENHKPHQRLPSHVRRLHLQGYRPFRDFTANLSELEVIVGANGSGKSSMFEFLRFLRDGMVHDIPPQIAGEGTGRQIFHRPGRDKFGWELEVDLGRSIPLVYEGELAGPIGRTRIPMERVRNAQPTSPDQRHPYVYVDVRDGQGEIEEPASDASCTARKLDLIKPNQLALSLITSPTLATPYTLREFIASWRFYSTFGLHTGPIRRPVPTQQDPVLYEDGSNLSAVLFYLMTEHPLIFDELKAHLRSAVPNFRNLTVKARGGPGEVIAFWQEQGLDEELSLADLSDGILRFMCWLTLCLDPDPPALMCIDEPAQGVHPRTLPILAGLFEKASARSQLLLATHSSYFLTHFDLSRIALMKKSGDICRYEKPVDSQILRSNLVDFGLAELETMHRNNELEVLV